jgi:signal transduction histidine kinase
MCSTCGAAISIVSSLGQNKTVERICALTAKRNGKDVEMALLVRSHPIDINKKRFILLFIQDITKQQQRAALERTFFHDINNMLGALVIASEYLAKNQSSEMAKSIHQIALRLNREVSIQRCLIQSESYEYQPIWDKFSTTYIFKEMQTFFINHPVAKGKNLNYTNNYPDEWIRTDIALLQRVLTNMILNALEATATDGTVKIWLGKDDDSYIFYVWNTQEIPKKFRNRIFQRNFSTKEQDGRGIGSYSMKLFGEKVLGGQVGFTSSSTNGTTFHFAIPA